MPKHRVTVLRSEGRLMSSINAISPDKLARLIGTSRAPVLIDVRTDEDFAADPRFYRRAFAGIIAVFLDGARHSPTDRPS